MTRLLETEKEEIYALFHNRGKSVRELVELYDSSQRTIRRIINSNEYDSYQRNKNDASSIEPDDEIITQNVLLNKQIQKEQDLNRIKNKAFRENARINNAIGEYGKALVDLLEDNDFSDLTVYHEITGDEVVGIIQLSDVHFNEQINLATNVYNFDVASKRIRKLVSKAKQYFRARNVTSVLFAMTGDMMNSDRRLDELLENAENRSKATFIAVDILQQAILDVNQDFNVTVASICGNEGRVNQNLGWIDQIASDNYDYTIHQTLSYMFKECEGVTFMPIDNPLEKVVSVCNKHILLIHGHNGISTNGNIESGVSKTISRYSVSGVKLDYVLMGHIHLANVSDFYARSGGLPGANAYSEKALNLYSRASQNIYIVDNDGIDGIKVDLQDTDGYNEYSFDTTLESYHSKSESKSRQNDVVIHKIVI